jgi:hypothetical protein
MALLRLPPRIPFLLLTATRVLAAMPSDLAAFHAARRSRDMTRRGVRGLVIEPLTALAYLSRAARHRWRGLRTSAQLAALGSASQRSLYRPVSFGRNGRYVLAGGLLVAVVGLLIGLI